MKPLPSFSLLRITAPHFIAGAEVDLTTQRITRTAPIIAYMRDWTLRRALDYCVKKRWSWEVKEPDNAPAPT